MENWCFCKNLIDNCYPKENCLHQIKNKHDISLKYANTPQKNNSPNTLLPVNNKSQ